MRKANVRKKVIIAVQRRQKMKEIKQKKQNKKLKKYYGKFNNG